MSTGPDLRRHFEQRADELARVANLRASLVGEFGECLLIDPIKGGALGVWLITWRTGDCYVGFNHDLAVPDEDPGTAERLDWFIDHAANGRVRLTSHRSIGAWEVNDDGGVQSGRRLRNADIDTFPAMVAAAGLGG